MIGAKHSSHSISLLYAISTYNRFNSKLITQSYAYFEISKIFYHKVCISLFMTNLENIIILKI